MPARDHRCSSPTLRWTGSLPTIRVRQQDLAAGPDQPWLWVNTEDLDIDAISEVDWTADPAGSRPRLTGVLRLGDAESLRDQLPFASRPTPIRDGSTSGADVWADYDLDSRLLALDASASVEVPRHVAVWRPTLTRCDDSVDDATACQDRQLYEIDKTETLGVQFRTTNAELGNLNVLADIHGDELDWTIHGAVEHVPGELLGQVKLANNLRLPWITLNLDFDANAPLGDVLAEVFDHNLPVEYRQSSDDPEDGGQCTEADDQCTANYAVALGDVPADLHVTARIQGEGEDRLTPSPFTVPDPSEPETSVGGIGYVHANLELGEAVSQLVVEGRSGADGKFLGTLHAFDAADNPAGLSGFLNARVDNLEIDLDNTTDAADPFLDFVTSGWGIASFLVLGPLLTFIIGGILELLFDGDLTTRFDMDLHEDPDHPEETKHDGIDLPLFLQFDQVDTIRFGMNGTTLSVDEHHAGGGGPATIATRQLAMDHETDLQVDGAYFHHRDVDFEFDNLSGLDEFFINNNVTEQLQDIGIFRHESCRTHNDDTQCYFPGKNGGLTVNEVTLDQVSAANAREGFDSGDAVIDLMFNADNRDEMEGEDAGEAEPGVEFYKKLRRGKRPVHRRRLLRARPGPRPRDDRGVDVRGHLVLLQRHRIRTDLRQPAAACPLQGLRCGVRPEHSRRGHRRPAGHGERRHGVRRLPATVQRRSRGQGTHLLRCHPTRPGSPLAGALARERSARCAGASTCRYLLGSSPAVIASPRTHAARSQSR